MPTRRLIALLVAAALFSGCGEKSEPDLTAAPVPVSKPAGPGGEPAGVKLVKLGDFTKPDFLAQPAGERNLYVVEKTGRIVRVAPGGARRTFLDLRGRISTSSEQGLLSVAFAPDYERSGRLYVDYTNKAGDTRVVEYERGGSRSNPHAKPGSARVVLKVPQPFANHNGGLLQFGLDSELYVGLGDGGSAGDPKRNGQNLGRLLGKVLRIDPRADGKRSYSVPKSNPFAHRKSARPEIYAYGLRNPWRFSFDRKTGGLWIGDVGQDQQEEIDGVKRAAGSGANFGWSAFEGTRRFNRDQKAPGAIGPVLVYGRDEGCSVTGGYVVRDRALKALEGRFVYGDYCQGDLRSFTATTGRRASDDRPVGVQVPSLSSFAEDQAGHVYAISLDGPVYRLAPR